jgi:hypothetical protein
MQLSKVYEKKIYNNQEFFIFYENLQRNKNMLKTFRNFKIIKKLNEIINDEKKLNNFLKIFLPNIMPFIMAFGPIHHAAMLQAYYEKNPDVAQTHADFGNEQFDKGVEVVKKILKENPQVLDSINNFFK